MEAFTILGRIISKTIRVVKSGRGFSLIVGPRKEIQVGDKDIDTTVIIDNGRAHIHYCGLVHLPYGKTIITAPFPHTGKNRTPDQQKVDYLLFDKTALVLWETRDLGATITQINYAEIKSQDAGNLLITFPPTSSLTLRIKGEHVTLLWSGSDFFWM